MPELCEHKPGRLINGVLPLQDPYNGDVAISSYGSGAYETATGDLTGDGVDDGVLVTACTAGGVSWPATIQAYTGDIRRLGGVDLGDVTAGGRETVSTLGIADGRIELEWLTTAEGDAACCGSVPVTATVRWTGTRLAVDNLIRHYDRQVVIKLVTSDDRDEAELRARLANESVLVPLEYLRYIAPDVEEQGCYGHPSTDARFPRQALAGKSPASLDPDKLATRYCVLKAQVNDWANSAVIGLRPTSDTTWHATMYAGPTEQ